MLACNEQIAWIGTDDLTTGRPDVSLGVRRLYVAWRNRHTRRVLCTSKGRAVPLAFLMMSDRCASGLLPCGDGRCATAKQEDTCQPNPTDISVQLRWPDGMESGGVPLGSLTAARPADEAAEAQAWMAFADAEDEREVDGGHVPM